MKWDYAAAVSVVLLIMVLLFDRVAVNLFSSEDYL